jgi:hypothetical protein
MRHVLGASLVFLGMVSCNSGGSPMAAGDAGPEAAAPSPELPPQGQKALEAWLAAGYYKGWHCEQQVSPSRGGAHGRDRVCTNDILHAAPSTPYPVGSASVVEMFDSADRSNGFAVSSKVAAGTGASTWYWYERAGSSPTSRPVADSIAYPTCGENCHSQAPMDNVFVLAP